MTGYLARWERFALVDSTNDVVRSWLANGTREVCLAVADEQAAGRGRAGRTWLAPPGAALLLSLGFRPGWLDPELSWRLAAITALAMAEAAELAAGLPAGAIRLKWPNDLVTEPDPTATGDGFRKLGGLLGETDGLGTADPRMVVGLGINADWPATGFPPGLAGSMTSLRETAQGRPIDRAGLLEAFLGRLETALAELRGGVFDAAGWQDRQLTTGRLVSLDGATGTETVRAVGVDAATGALVIEDASAPGGQRRVIVGEVGHVRLAPVAEAAV